MADDRFFHKTNDSDATQFAILYPRIGAHGKSRDFSHPSDYSVSSVWATIWIIFQLACLAGFAVLGIYAFKVCSSIVVVLSMPVDSSYRSPPSK